MMYRYCVIDDDATETTLIIVSQNMYYPGLPTSVVYAPKHMHRYWNVVAEWHLMASWIWLNIDSVDGWVKFDSSSYVFYGITPRAMSQKWSWN